MRTISDTIERLSRYRARPFVAGQPSTSLKPLAIKSRNPGELTARYQTPRSSVVAPALVVALHGCTQTAGGYDYGSGWSKLADDYGFAVLFPEQSRHNNPNLCFNWFNDDDISRDRGEVLSIREMVSTMVAEHRVDPKRVFVTGLSAGGAMANALLATYPEVFAGGAIIAGLPYGAASTVPEAFDRMRGHGLPVGTVLEARLREASSHAGPWPTISVWQGTADNTVVRANGDAIIDQWRSVHGAGADASFSERVDGHLRQIWQDDDGREVIDLYLIDRMGHGTPLDTASGYGHAGPYMLDVGISSTLHIARSWGLTAIFDRRAAAAAVGGLENAEQNPHSAGSAGIQKVIEGALRSAGLLK
jgi:poly(hydroxyalkanoate) depolymerase family esterase